MAPVDAERLERDGWLAAVAGGELRTRTITPQPRFAGPGLSVAEVAYEVDAGRELAAQAARDGVTVLIATGDSPHAAPLAAWLDDDAREGGPLRALRGLGDGVLCVLAGVALGAGEHGLGYAADGPAALAAGRLAAAVEPELAPRLTTVEELPT